MDEYSITHCFFPEHYCVLCLQSLPPWLDTDFPPPTPNEWDAQIVGFCNVAANPFEPPQLSIFGIDLGLASSCHPERLSGYMSDGEPWEVCRFGMDCEQSRLHKTFFFAHACCWKAVREHYGPVSITDLYRLATATRPMTAWSRVKEPPQPPIGGVPTGLSLETELGSTLHHIDACFPLEIQQMIFEYIRPDRRLDSRHRPCSLVYQLLVSLETATTLEQIRHAINPPLYYVALPVSRQAASVLCAEPVKIFGQWYLHRLHLVSEQDAPAWSLRLPIKTETAVRAVKFVLGCYGMRRIRLLYADGSSSDWLGALERADRASRCWYAEDPISNLGDLLVVKDNLRVFRLSQSQAMPGYIYWARDIRPESGLSHCIEGWPWARHARVLSHSNSTFAQYLSLKDIGRQKRRSVLTVFCSHYGVTGFMVNGNRDTMIGNSDDLPISIELACGEHIKLVLSHRSALSHPLPTGFSIVLTTNLGRVVLFGPPAVATSRGVGPWTALTLPESGPVRGLFINSLSARGAQPASIGVSAEPANGTGTSSWPVDGAAAGAATKARLLLPPRNSNAAVDRDNLLRACMGELPPFFSSTGLTDASELHVQRAGDHCHGLRVVHSNGDVDFLGQWDPSDPASISCVYDHVEDGSLWSITFVLHRAAGRQHRVVVDIRVNDKPSGYVGAVQSTPGTAKLVARRYSSGELASNNVGWWFGKSMDNVGLFDAVARQLNPDVSRIEGHLLHFRE